MACVFDVKYVLMRECSAESSCRDNVCVGRVGFFQIVRRLNEKSAAVAAEIVLKRWSARTVRACEVEYIIDSIWKIVCTSR